MKEPAQRRQRQREAAETLRLCKKNLELWEARNQRVREKLLEELERARERYWEAATFAEADGA